MRKVLLICGPTATGKTDLAFFLADQFPSVIISADSRQVYRGMDIVTGKDTSTKHPLFGIDLVEPDQPFSVSHFIAYTHDLINQSEHLNKLPIIVGGTGLYLKSLIQPPATISIPPDPTFRGKLAKLSVEQLQSKLKKLNPSKFNSLNHSDLHNPRRLIRALEILQGSTSKGSTSKGSTLEPLWLGLTAPLKALDHRIQIRVKARVESGALKEWQQLQAKYPPHLPSMSAIGYRDLPDTDKWVVSETQYARRQLTWFAKQPDIHWFDITLPIFKTNVAKTVRAWYTK